MGTGEVSSATGSAHLRVLVVSPHALYRSGLARLLAGGGALAVSESADLDGCGTADVIVLADVPATTVRAAASAAPTARIVLIGEPGDEAVDGAIVVDRRAGVDAVLAALTQPATRTRPAWTAPAFEVAPLTNREHAVLCLVAEGRTSAAIAGLLGISARTVDNHKRRVFQKLGARSQAQAVALALRAQIIPVSATRGAAPHAEMAG